MIAMMIRSPRARFNQSMPDKHDPAKCQRGAFRSAGKSVRFGPNLERVVADILYDVWRAAREVRRHLADEDCVVVEGRNTRVRRTLLRVIDQDITARVCLCIRLPVLLAVAVSSAFLSVHVAGIASLHCDSKISYEVFVITSPNIVLQGGAK